MRTGKPSTTTSITGLSSHAQLARFTAAAAAVAKA